MEKKIKLVVVGDSYVGKTSLLSAYTKKEFVDNYATTVFDNWAVTVNIDQRQYTVNLFDTAGQEDYGHLRCLSYPGTDVFLLCFSLVERASLNACLITWMPEIRKYVDSNTPVLLVGTKEDLHETERDSSKRVSFDEATRAAQQMGAIKFLACSSLTHRGLKRVFDEALMAALGRPIPDTAVDQNCCQIM